MSSKAQYSLYIKYAARDVLRASLTKQAKAEDKPELQEPTTKERTWNGMHNQVSRREKPIHLTLKPKIEKELDNTALS